MLTSSVVSKLVKTRSSNFYISHYRTNTTISGFRYSFFNLLSRRIISGTSYSSETIEIVTSQLFSLTSRRFKFRNFYKWRNKIRFYISTHIAITIQKREDLMLAYTIRPQSPCPILNKFRAAVVQVQVAPFSQLREIGLIQIASKTLRSGLFLHWTRSSTRSTINLKSTWFMTQMTKYWLRRPCVCKIPSQMSGFIPKRVLYSFWNCNFAWIPKDARRS